MCVQKKPLYHYSKEVSNEISGGRAGAWRAHVCLCQQLLLRCSMVHYVLSVKFFFDGEYFEGVSS